MIVQLKTRCGCTRYLEVDMDLPYLQIPLEPEHRSIREVALEEIVFYTRAFSRVRRGFYLEVPL